MPPGEAGRSLEEMTARQIDEAATRLRELRTQAVSDLVLAGVVFALAVTASQTHPSLALPLLIGGMAVTFLGLHAFVRRSFLVEDLAGEPTAYVISDIRSFGARAASRERRQLLARVLRTAAEDPASEVAARIAAVRPELEALIAALEDDGRPLEPQAAVELERRLRDSDLLLRDPSLSISELRSRLRSLLASFEP
jgi:hypothetical protein